MKTQPPPEKKQEVKITQQPKKEPKLKKVPIRNKIKTYMKENPTCDHADVINFLQKEFKHTLTDYIDYIKINFKKNKNPVKVLPFVEFKRAKLNKYRSEHPELTYPEAVSEMGVMWRKLDKKQQGMWKKRTLSPTNESKIRVLRTKPVKNEDIKTNVNNQNKVSRVLSVESKVRMDKLKESTSNNISYNTILSHLQNTPKETDFTKYIKEEANYVNIAELKGEMLKGVYNHIKNINGLSFKGTKNKTEIINRIKQLCNFNYNEYAAKSKSDKQCIIQKCGLLITKTSIPINLKKDVHTILQNWKINI